MGIEDGDLGLPKKEVPEKKEEDKNENDQKNSEDLSKWRTESETFQVLQKALEGVNGISLENEYDLKGGGAGLIARIKGENGGEVEFFEWENFDDNEKSIGKDVPSELMIKVGIDLAKKLETKDTAKIGPKENSNFVHTSDPERVLSILYDIEEIKIYGEPESPSDGYKRYTIGFVFEK